MLFANACTAAGDVQGSLRTPSGLEVLDLACALFLAGADLEKALARALAQPRHNALAPLDEERAVLNLSRRSTSQALAGGIDHTT